METIAQEPEPVTNLYETLEEELRVNQQSKLITQIAISIEFYRKLSLAILMIFFSSTPIVQVHALLMLNMVHTSFILSE